jgi:hypothetical protein
MDLYLPADFHELHDAAADDWRDLSTSTVIEGERKAARDIAGGDRPSDAFNGCADPFWRVF